MSKLASSTIGFSGAQLRNVINQAAILAVLEEKEAVTQKHIENAFSESLAGVKRPLLLEDIEKDIRAYYESGKALVSVLTPNARSIYQATIVPHGNTLSHVQTIGQSEYSITSAQLHALMDVSFAGRIAEELMFGLDNVTTCGYFCLFVALLLTFLVSASIEDFKKCYDIAKELVLKSGFSELGYLGSSRDEMGDEMQERVDAEIDRILKVFSSHFCYQSTYCTVLGEPSSGHQIVKRP